MVKPPILRTKSVTTKVTEAEYARLEEQAELAGLNLSEWIRGRLLGTGRPGNERTGGETTGNPDNGADEVVLGEVLALRTILMNLLFSISQGKPVTAEAMRELMDRADGDKSKRAMERLRAVRATIPTTISEPKREAEMEAETNPEEG